MDIIEKIISQVIMPQYSSMLIDVLESKSVNTVALITMIVSVYTVSRGVGNIYEVSKNSTSRYWKKVFLVIIFILLRSLFLYC